MVLEVLKAGLAILVLVALQVGVEATWRRFMPLRAAKKDRLAGHGCGTCADREGCPLPPASADPLHP